MINRRHTENGENGGEKGVFGTFSKDELEAIRNAQAAMPCEGRSLSPLSEREQEMIRNGRYQEVLAARRSNS